MLDLVLMFLLSSACNHLLLTEEKGSSSFLMNDSSLLVQLIHCDFYGLSLPARAKTNIFQNLLVLCNLCYARALKRLKGSVMDVSCID